jgi:low molecular weight protein-tyrosine phosphatase
VKLLFVCMGNICRSPVVEAVVRSEFARAGLVADLASAATESYHAGGQADPRSIASARLHGYDLSAHRARQIDDTDFAAFDAVLVMDNTNLRTLRARCPHELASRLGLFLPFAGLDTPVEVPDPYYGGAEDFERVIQLARRGARGLLARYAMAHNMPRMQGSP